MTSRGGFTLIELLAVIAIIGVLVSLGSYLFIEAQAQARDATRKSDLNQIAEAFSARQLDKTCPDPTAVGFYPGETLEQNQNQVWLKVSRLANYTDGCGSFTQYLPTIPADRGEPLVSYYFNLSTATSEGPAASHYRLTTALEHVLSTVEQQNCVATSQVWVNSFGGQPYDCAQNVITPEPRTYNYYIGE
jgi:prepilin-type N-terminal cleavage/methylation domain-containing protein